MFDKLDNTLIRMMGVMSEVCNNVINAYIEDYYEEYEPEYYRRTYQFMMSCVRSDVYKEGNYHHVDIFIDYHNLHYKIKNPLVIVEWANQGLHGGLDVTEKKSHFWDDAINVLIPDEAILINNFIYWLEKNTGCEVIAR